MAVFLEPPVRLELTTTRLQNGSSTTELLRLVQHYCMFSRDWQNSCLPTLRSAPRLRLRTSGLPNELKRRRPNIPIFRTLLNIITFNFPTQTTSLASGHSPLHLPSGACSSCAETPNETFVARNSASAILN